MDPIDDIISKLITVNNILLSDIDDNNLLE